MTRLLCALFRHPLIDIRVYERGHAIVGQRCRCAHRVEQVRVFPKLYAIRGGRS